MLAAQTRGVLQSLFSRPKLTWIVPDQVAAMALPSPRELSRLRRMGITLLVSVTTTPLNPEDVTNAGLRYLHLPVMYLRRPSPEQIQSFITYTKAEIAAGGKIAVHCVGGIGRTGTVIACYLVDQGMPAREAITYVRAKRQGSVESLEQENAVYQWAKQKAAREALEAVLHDVVEADELGLPMPVDVEAYVAETYEPEIEATPVRPALREEKVTPMTRIARTGYLRWHPDGTGVEIRSLSTSNGDSPKIEHLKAALQSLETDNGIAVTLTETLGRSGEAWVTLSCTAGEQGTLLVTTGMIVNLLVGANVYDEVLLSSE
jgi:atypical dual specificity phosphatase